MRVTESSDRTIKVNDFNIKRIIKEPEVKSISNNTLDRSVEPYKGKFIDRRV